MTNWEKEGNYLRQFNISNFNLPTEIFEELKTLIFDNKIEKDNRNDRLAGHIKEEYGLPISENISNYFSWCSSQEPVIKQIDKNVFLTKGTRIVCNSLWVNFQKKYEFNPLHNHNGFASFICFIKIPYDLNDEEKYFEVSNTTQNHTSKLSFLFNNFDGQPVSYCVDVDKSFEGKMLMFNSKQYHMVYPFYTSDEYRITVSGNLSYKV